MRIHSKRWRKWRRYRWRRTVRVCLDILAKPIVTEQDMQRRNRAAKILNARVRYPRQEGLALMEGSVQCPDCKSEVFLIADPCEWSPLRQDEVLNGIAGARWRRGREQHYRVTDYWGGTGECCGTLFATQPDGELDCYSLRPHAT